MSVKSKHSSKKSSLNKKEKKRKIEDSEEDVESSEEELDLTKECHPIGYYMNDRPEMINQMFSVIKGNKLKAMIPPILKDYDLEQLKLQCLDQLLGMSEKRITCILEGETLETSSESDVNDSEECDSDEKNGTSGSSSDKSEDSHHGSHSNNVNSKHRKRKRDSSPEGKEGKVLKSEPEQQEQGKTLLEILELEMRARAIRALLKQSGNDKGNDTSTEENKTEVNGVKENSSNDVVDLTECEEEEIPCLIKKEKTEEEEIDKKVSHFEEKIEKAKAEKLNQKEDEKTKKLQAELELRNKLFKKKIYRTRQQRMENEEEEKTVEKNEERDVNESITEVVVVKQEPVEQEEVVVEDPEEGEISTSEDEYPVEIKQEPQEVEEDIDKDAPDLDDYETKMPEDPLGAEDFETKIDRDAERVTAIDNGTFVSNSNMEILPENVKEPESKQLEDSTSNEIQSNNNDSLDNLDESQVAEDESESLIEGTSWRDRWLQKDGVQKLVKSSKILTKVKKRIAQKSQKAKEEAPNLCDINSDSNSNSKFEFIEGKIEEYEKLSGKQDDKDGDQVINESSKQTVAVEEKNDSEVVDKT